MRAVKPIVVGSFVFGALALGVLAIVLFGGMHLLDVDALHEASWMPVYLDLDLSQVSWTNGSFAGTHADLQRAVDAGLRAQLVPQSLVSGELYVNFDLLPQTAARLAHRPNEVFEIPSIPSDMQDLKEQFRQLNLPELGLQTRKTLLSMQHVLDELQSRVGPLADSLRDTASTTAAAVRGLQTDAARTLADIDRLANEGHRQIAVDGPELDRLLQRATQSADHADAMIASLNEMTSPRSPLREDLQASLRDLAASASSLRDLTHDLPRLPQNRVVWSDPSRKSTRELLVDVEGFDAWPDGHCVLSATWSLTDVTNGAVLGGAQETFTVAPARGGTQSDVRVVAGMADVLGKLADSIASTAAARHLTRRGALELNR